MRLLSSSQMIKAAALVGCALTLGLSAGCTHQPDQVIQQRLDGDSLTLAWTYDTGGSINQPPLRVNDVLIAIGAGRPLVALNVGTGTLRWQYDPPDGVWERAYASDGRLVFVGVGGGRLVALDAQTGQTRWAHDLGINVQLPPLIEGDVVYVPTTFVGPALENDPQRRAQLFALAISHGQALWSFETGNYILQTPFRYGDDLYVAGVYHDPANDIEEGGHTRLYALSAVDGAVRWSYESEDGFPKSLYATEASVAFVGYQDFINGVDAATGKLRWRRDASNWVPALSGVGHVIYYGAATTVVYAVNANDGQLVWQYNIPEGTFNYVLGAPIRVQDDLYFLTQHGDIVALNALDGTLRWKLATGIRSRVQMTVSGGWLFIGDEDGMVYAYTSHPKSVSRNP